MNLNSYSASPTLDTAAYAAGDYIAKGSIANVFAGNGRAATLVSLTVLDTAKQKAAFDIFFFNADPTVASAVNAAIDIADAQMTSFIGHLSIATSDYATDLAGSSIATQKNIQLALDSAVDSTTLYYVLVSRGSPTYAADSLTIKLNVVRH